MAGLGAYSGRWADRYGNGLVVAVGGILIAAGYIRYAMITFILIVR